MAGDDRETAISEQQRSVLAHLRTCGGMTMPALGVLIGNSARRILRVMLSRRLVRTSEADGVRLFLAANVPLPATEESFKRRVAFGWLYARVVQAGCEWIVGVFPEVVFPAGSRYRIAWRGKAGDEKSPVLALVPDDQKTGQAALPANSLSVYTRALRERKLREALKKSY